MVSSLGHCRGRLAGRRCDRDFGEAGWAGYFAAFQQQLVPTDDLGNPQPSSQPIR
jgi:hypothetical protein